MPPTGYLSVAAIEAGLKRINDLYPSFTELIELPEQSVEKRQISGLRIRSGSDQRNGVLLVGGMHACELINPDLLLGLAIKICWAHANGAGLAFGGPGLRGIDFFGGKRYSSTDVKVLVDGLDIFIVPNVNPDGRDFVLLNYEDQWDWRKNCRDNGSGVFGVDLNRNFDIVWEESIGSSDMPDNTKYQGEKPFSEPETRNVRWLLRSFPRITGLADVHSFWEGIMYPWGHTLNQSTYPTQNFRNPEWDDRRDPVEDASGYQEYIPEADLAKYIDRGQQLSDAIYAVRGRRYEVGQPINVINQYTSSTTRDYAYSRFFVGPNTKVWAYTIETNREGPGGDTRYGYSPPYDDAVEVMEEVQAGLVEFMLSFVCVVREVGRGPLGPDTLDDLSDFGDMMLTRRRGRGWAELLNRHNDELLRLVSADRGLRKEAEAILVEATKVVLSRDKRPAVITESLTARIDRLAARVEERASPPLREAVASVREDLRSVVGKTAFDAIGEEIGPAGSSPEMA
jgi:carboxypeptidase T